MGGPFGQGSGQRGSGYVVEMCDDVVLELHGKLHGRADVARDHGALEVDNGRLHEVAYADEGCDGLEAAADARV